MARLHLPAPDQAGWHPVSATLNGEGRERRPVLQGPSEVDVC